MSDTDITLRPQSIVYDRTRTTTDWTCPRERYYRFEFDGPGISPDDDAQELFTGTLIHDAMAAIARSHPKVDIDTIASNAYKAMYEYLVPADFQGNDDIRVYGLEQATLLEGLIRGFYKHVWPVLMERYAIISVEQEMFYTHDIFGKPSPEGPFIFMSKPDLILAPKDDLKHLIYFEYKSTSSKKEEWINSWNTAVQVHSTIAAVEQSLKNRPHAAIVQGLYKGWEAYGKQSSPFCYGYLGYAGVRSINKEISYEYKSGWRRTPTWEMEGGVKGWVEGMPGAILADQFPQTPPIFPNDDIILDYFSQRAMREMEIRQAKQLLKSADPQSAKVILNGTFPQRFDQCVKSYGKGRSCAMRHLCHGNCTDPLKAGFSRRTPHHQLEQDLLDSKFAPPKDSDK